MPTEDERPENMPDTSEVYERADPETEPGLGRMDEQHQTPVEQPDDAQSSTRNTDDKPEKIAHEPIDGSDTIDPADARAHAGRPDAAKTSGNTAGKEGS